MVTSLPKRGILQRQSSIPAGKRGVRSGDEEQLGLHIVIAAL